MPRHPPCALTILTVIVIWTGPQLQGAIGPGDTHLRPRVGVWTQGTIAGLSIRDGDVATVQFSRTAKRARVGLTSRSLKTQQHASALKPDGMSVLAQSSSVDVSSSTDLVCAGSRMELPRKEVIQPHLPVRLPCYDFTPVTSPTFDGSPLAG